MKIGRHHMAGALMTALVIFLCCVPYFTSLRGGLEQRAYDDRVRIVDTLGLGINKTTGQVVIVGIDETSFIGEKPILFICEDIGKLVQLMDRYHAAAIGIDIILPNRQREILRNAAMHFIHGSEQKKIKYRRLLEDIGEHLDGAALQPIMDVAHRTKIIQVVNDEVVPFYYGTIPNITFADTLLSDAVAIAGGGVVRKQKLSRNGRKSFGAALYALAAENKEPHAEEVFLNYSLASSVPFYCMTDVVDGKIDGSAFAGKTVILGFVSGFVDVYETPLKRDIYPRCSTKNRFALTRSTSGRMPGPLIHGLVAETMLTASSIKEVGRSVNVAIIVCLAIVSSCLVMLVRPWFAMPAVLLMVVLYGAGNILVFSKGVYIHVFPSILAPAGIIIFLYPYRYFVEERLRRKVQKVFGYYVDRKVLDALIEKHWANLMMGESRRICILFLDIRNFTALSGRMAPRKIMGFLNVFFGKATEIIQHNGGFVNKFIGDGILAYFMTGQNLVKDAISAGTAIIAETARFNREGRFADFIGDWEINVGMGVHYGEVVMGNIGSERKMDFTIIGEHVNIASRIEALTKEVEKCLLVSADAQAVAPDLPWVNLGQFVVRGVEYPLTIYCLREEGENTMMP